MLYGSSTGVFALAAALMVTIGGVQAADATRRRETTRRGTIRGIWALVHALGLALLDLRDHVYRRREAHRQAGHAC
jgi:hypothetical protein